MTSADTDQDSNFANTVLKSLDLLECLANSEHPLTAPQIAKQCGMSRPTAYRLLATLQSRGYVRNNEHEYSLGMKILSLSRVILESIDLANEAYPYLLQLSQLSGETTYVSLLDGTEILYINKVESTQPIRLSCSIGARNPLYSTSMGKAMLAFLPAENRQALLNQITLQPFTERTLANQDVLLRALEGIRQRGYSSDDRENEETVRCIGAPIFNHMGYPFAAMSIAGPAFRLTMEQLDDLAPQLMDVTRTLSKRFGYQPDTNGHRRARR